MTSGLVNGLITIHFKKQTDKAHMLYAFRLVRELFHTCLMQTLQLLEVNYCTNMSIQVLSQSKQMVTAVLSHEAQ